MDSLNNSMIVILFIAIAVPLALMVGLVEKKSKLSVVFMIIGMFMCLFVSALNGMFLNSGKYSLFFITTNITPVTEEVVKAFSVLFFAFFVSDKRETLLSISLAVGIGFAILENAYIIVNNINSFNIVYAVFRAFGAGLMHGLCTAMVGFGASFVRKRKKLFYSGTFALLIAAITYHSVYNILVQSKFMYIGYALPIITYFPALLALKKIRKNSSKTEV